MALGVQRMKRTEPGHAAQLDTSEPSGERQGRTEDEHCESC